MGQKNLNIKVVPRSSVSRVEEDLLGDLKVRVRSAPVKGKANQEVIKVLAGYFNISKDKIEIIKGESSRNKVIRINKNPT